jgi:hypothetical protein
MALMRRSDPAKLRAVTALWFGGLCLVVQLLVGCQTTTVDTWQPVQGRQKSQIHTVTWEHENLRIIAKWYTGSEQNWKEIADANPNILPVQLHPGDRIFIPTLLVKTRAPMPKSFLDEWRLPEQLKEAPEADRQMEASPLLVPRLHKLKQASGVPGPPPPPDIQEPDGSDDLELFGPR